MQYPIKILMTKPHHFKIAYVINDHMDMNNQANQELALKQWQSLKDTYTKLGFEVIEKEDLYDLPDMVFCANPIFTYHGKLILSNMKNQERQREPSIFKDWLSHLEILSINSTFEGMGDLLINYPTGKLYGGYGHRTNLSAYDEIEKTLDVKISKLKLMTSNYYHLDTCLSLINEECALYVESAFNEEALELLRKDFKNLIKVDEDEALKYLACNAHSPNGKQVIVEKNAVILQDQLRKANLEPILIDTSEFLKSGGSIFCMKNQGWF